MGMGFSLSLGPRLELQQEQEQEQKLEQKLELRLVQRLDPESFKKIWEGCNKRYLRIDGNRLQDQDANRCLRFNPRANADGGGIISYEYALINSKRLNPRIIKKCGAGLCYAETDGFMALFLGFNNALRQDGKFYQFVVEDLVQAGDKTPLYQDIIAVHELGEEIFLDHSKARKLENNYAIVQGCYHEYKDWFKKNWPRAED